MTSYNKAELTDLAFCRCSNIAVLIFWYLCFLRRIPSDTSHNLEDLLIEMLKRNPKDRIEFSKKKTFCNVTLYLVVKTILF